MNLAKIVSSGAESISGLETSGKSWVQKLTSQGIIKPGMRILDYGAGVGRVAMHLDNVLAVDALPEMVAHMQDKGINAVQADNLSEVSGEFDLIMAFFVFQHMGFNRVREFCDVASKKTNKILFTVPQSGKGYKPGINTDTEFHPKGEVSFYYKPEQVRGLVRPFKPKRVEMKNVTMYLGEL